MYLLECQDVISQGQVSHNIPPPLNGLLLLSYILRHENVKQ